MNPPDVRERLKALGFHGLVQHWDEVKDKPWVPWLIQIESEVNQQRSLQRRIAAAKLGKFKAMADFDWSWPATCDRAQLEELFTGKFIQSGTNVILVGQNGLGKTMIAKNMAYQALLAGHRVLFVSASAMLNDLAAQDSASALRRRLAKYCRPAVLAIDELGYLSYGNRHADLLFEVVTRRYEGSKPVIVTTNRAFSDWNQTFPNASCVVTLIDRLVHRSEIVHLEGESYRLKEAKERAETRKRRRSAKS